MSSETHNLVPIVFGFAIVLRVLVALHPHSGQDNYEGSHQAYGGDFEAQRHWMELTWHLPIGEWYWYDLQYWGLDYPPLTAYVSYLCGMASHFLVGPHTVALETSRAIEDSTHKAFMRATVLLLDILVYFTAVWFALDRRNVATMTSGETKLMHSLSPSSQSQKSKWLWTLTLALSQPAIVLIDHGHFQYNTVALGLSIAAFSFMVQPNFKHCIVGSILYCLALNFKQMTLYYAPAVFCYLLGRCFSEPNRFFPRFLALGCTVLLTFVVLWAPIIFAADPSGTPYIDRIQHVLRRIFPFQRGLFEGKVANIWCALSTKPVKIRDRVDPALQPLLALALTFVLMLGACIRMFNLGMEAIPHPSISDDGMDMSNNFNTPDSISTSKRTQRHWTLLLWASMSTALSFFLASFQVHEKSILLALAPCSLLLWQDPCFVHWFSIVACWTLWPLLQTDRLQVPYICCMITFTVLIFMSTKGEMVLSSSSTSTPMRSYSCFSGIPWSVIPILTYLGMILLHACQCVITVPVHLPDLFEVLWSLTGCGMFCISWCVTIVHLFAGPLNRKDAINSQNNQK